MMNKEQRTQLMAAINNEPSNPPGPRLTVTQRDELRALVEAGREEEAWSELSYKWNVATGKAMALLTSKAAEMRKEHREVIEHESRMNADKKVPQVGAGGTAADAAGKAKAGGRPKGQQGELLQKIIDALATWAKSANETFDENSMPGQVGNSADDESSFHWLCAKLYPTEFRKGKKAFKGYRAGHCTFPAYAKKSDFYSRAIGHIAQTLGVSLNVTTINHKSQKAA